VYRDGMPMANSSDQKAFFNLNYDIPNVLGGDMWLYYDVSYASESWNRTSRIIDGDVNGLSPSRVISNFQMGLNLANNLSFTLQVDNLWDQENYDYVSTGDNYAQEWFGATRERNMRSLTRPRTVSLVVRKGF